MAKKHLVSEKMKQGPISLPLFHSRQEREEGGGNNRLFSSYSLVLLIKIIEVRFKLAFSDS